MNKTDLPRPWMYNNKWAVWPETALDVMEISSCKDTIKGECEVKKSVQDCINECDASCGLGYHIEFENGNTICSTIRTDIHKHLNPIHRLKRKDSYPEFSNLKISTFINTDLFPFPPEEANVVFYQDVINIFETANGVSIKSETGENIIKEDNHIYLKKNGKHNLTFSQSVPTLDKIEKYIPVLYGDQVQIAIPGTSLLMCVTSENELVWNFVPKIFFTEATTFELVPLDSTKKIGDIVTYGDVFAICRINDRSSFVVVDEKYSLILVRGNIEKVLNNEKYISKFSIKSKMLGYYCNEQECKSVKIKDMEAVGKKGYYKGAIVGRDPNCLGQCKYLKPGADSTIPLSTIAPAPKSSQNIIILIIAILSMIFIFILSIIIVKKFKLYFFGAPLPPPYSEYAS